MLLKVVKNQEVNEMKRLKNYEGFMNHLAEWDKNNVAYSLNDMRILAKKYNVPVPDEYK